jgi:hypothetical protein
MKTAMLIAIALATIATPALADRRDRVDDHPREVHRSRTVLYGVNLGNRDRHHRHHRHHRDFRHVRPVHYVSYPQPVIVQPPVQTIVISQNGLGQCREYQSTVIVGNRKQQSYGTACLQPDGSWSLVN